MPATSRADSETGPQVDLCKHTLIEGHRTVWGVLVAAMLWACLGSPATAAEAIVTYRSLRAEGHDRLDELDLPRRTRRICHWGWEVRTRHFVVFSTVSPEQANWTAQEMERAWSDVGLLADQWTDVHRRPEFGIGAVGVLVNDRPLRANAQPAPGPRTTNYSPNLYISQGDGPSSREERLVELRREAFLAFLRATGQDQVLPDWVQAGLAAHLSGAEPPDGSAMRPDPPEPAGDQPSVAWARRVVADRMAPLSMDRQRAILWVRYLLEGDDAKYAVPFLAGLRTLVAGHPQDPFLPGEGVRGAARFETRLPPNRRCPLEQLTMTPGIREEFADWLADAKAGQPVVETTPGEMPPDERQREMVLILKLARRFALPPTESIRPKVSEYGTGGTATIASSPEASEPESVAELYERLADPDRAPWATLDTDGRLLLSGNRRRLADVFANPDRRYRTYRRDGNLVLEVRFATGDVFEAWLEENAENPRRPVARIRRKPMDHMDDEPPPDLRSVAVRSRER